MAQHRQDVRSDLESAWHREVCDIARSLGWAYYHTVNPRKSNAGFPDLVLVRERIIFAELKREKGGRVSEAQQDWFDLLTLAGAECYIWKPSDRDMVDRVLSVRVVSDPRKPLKGTE